ncbi:putative inactive leucine-rich repeat receptor kinase XIAO [Wolffia australiana]
MDSLGGLHHWTLIVLRGYYPGPPWLLEYDYMPNGTLGALLGDQHVLSWPMRHAIMLGVACALAMLHAVGVTHGDMQGKNLLFNADFEPHVWGFRLRHGEGGPQEGNVAGLGGCCRSCWAGRGRMQRECWSGCGGGLERGRGGELVWVGVLGLWPGSGKWEEFLLGLKLRLLCAAPEYDG